MSTTIPALDPVTDILDTDKIMVTQSSGQTYTMSGANFNKRNQAVIASSTTLTGAPLKTGNIVRAYFTADITGVNTTTGLVLNYNGTNKNVKVPKDGALVNFTAQNMGGSPTVYKYLQAYTTLELLYDGTNFVIIGNPVVISSADYTIYADGKIDGWIYIPINFTFDTVTTNLSVVKTLDVTVNELLIVTNIGVLHIIKTPNQSEVKDVCYSYLYTGYNSVCEIGYVFNTKKIRGRQTLKENNADWITVYGAYYH